MATGDRRRDPRDFFYGEVLQLPPGTKRPDHYALLGLAYFESDHDAVLRAALERRRALEACQADPRPQYRKVLAEILVDLREAQMTLLDPAKRQAYDARLTGRSARPAAPKEEPKEYEIPTGKMFAGRYRILGVARRGGLGYVHDALDSNLRTRVHLSVLAPHLSRERVLRRPVEQAARAAAAIDHPSLLRIDEVGDAEGLLFFRTRAPEGKNLLERIESTPQMRLDPAEARRIALEIAAALEHAHAQGCVHGDLRPHNVFVDANGRVLVADLRVARAFQDAAGLAMPRREPENEAAPPADLHALGALLHQMLAGMPPGDAPKELPPDVPPDLAAAVARLLAPDPGARPASAGDALALLRPRQPRSRRPLVWAAAAAVVLAAAGFAALGGGGQPAVTVKERAWQLIAEGRNDEAAESLRAARAKAPQDATLVPPLAKALEGMAAAREEHELYAAQKLLAEALALEPAAERETALRRVKARALERLAAIAVEIPPVAPEAIVVVRPGDAALAAATVGGQRQAGGGGELRFAFDLADGPHELLFELEDPAGNTRSGTVAFTVDRTPPAVEITAPKDGASFRTAAVEVRARVADAHPALVLVNGRPAPLRDGEVAETLRLEDGDHAIEIVVRDEAGHESRASIRILVDTRTPDLSLASDRLVTPDGRAVVRGRLGSPVRELTVDGRPVEVAEDGSFAAEVTVAEERLVPVVATGITGIPRKLSARVVVDPDPPEVAVRWERKSPQGVLLYGGKEMDAGVVALPLEVKDRTQVSFHPEEGRVEDGAWKLGPIEGAHQAVLVVRDEAGRETAVRVSLEGHRTHPRLDVKCPARDVTNEEDTVLEVEAEGDLFLQGAPAAPGRHRIPLPEGRVALALRAVDRYGNESHWRRELLVDRTPPRLELVGDTERGIGLQELEFKANEPLVSLTCFGKTYDVSGELVRIEASLRPGRKGLTVIARDRAGNSTKANFALTVRNRALVLDGRSSLRVDLPRDLRLDEFTLECWVKGHAPAGTQGLFSNYQYPGSGFALMWCAAKEPLPYAVVNMDVTGRVLLPAKKGWRWEEWTHVAVSYDRKRLRFYVDGSLQQSVEIVEVLRPSTAPLYVGSDSDNRYHFRGELDELRISSVARYTKGFTPVRYHRHDADTVLLLRFDTLEGELHTDSSGHGRHARPLGAPRLE